VLERTEKVGPDNVLHDEFFNDTITDATVKPKSPAKKHKKTENVRKDLLVKKNPEWESNKNKGEEIKAAT